MKCISDKNKIPLVEIWVAYSFLHKINEKQLEEQFAQLPAYITESVYRYKNPADKSGRMISKLLLETLIKKYFPYQGFSWDHYRKDSFSKPYLEGSAINFSTSHHEATSMVCITSGSECGIDSELLKPVNTDLYQDFMHSNEKDFIRNHIDPVKSFYEIWTRKEAVLKASGLGVSCELNSVDAHSDEVLVQGLLYVTTPLFLSENMITHLATREMIKTLHLEEIIF